MRYPIQRGSSGLKGRGRFIEPYASVAIQSNDGKAMHRLQLIPHYVETLIRHAQIRTILFWSHCRRCVRPCAGHGLRNGGGQKSLIGRFVESGTLNARASIDSEFPTPCVVHIRVCL